MTRFVTILAVLAALTTTQAQAISLGQWWMALTPASKAAIVAGAAAVPVAATVINLRNKQRADSQQLQDEHRQQLWQQQQPLVCVKMVDGNCTLLVPVEMYYRTRVPQ